MTTDPDVPTAAHDPADRATVGWSTWYRRILPAYWVFLFCSTHFPKLTIGVEVPSIDKILHAVCYGLLAYLFWRFAETFRRPLSGRFVWLALLWLAAYGAIDELLQSYVNRGTDLGDWLANMMGVGPVLAVLEWRRRRATEGRAA